MNRLMAISAFAYLVSKAFRQADSLSPWERASAVKVIPFFLTAAVMSAGCQPVRGMFSNPF
ncbi:hypothetical protein P24_10645 [Oceanibaculum indicum P24]|uniref:Uncharacterized protein n=1 Tax=Oceanibaculum indicum P24 TaxID=1207063 RepID=K2JYB1_9PROT|nr:hypothetical protein P24_10645 [Oceanibaculum indicum P24]